MTYEEYDINGYTFYTEAKDKNSDYQNSGITMESYTRDIKLRYYGRIVEILELDYSREKVPMFRVRWAKSVIKEDRGFTTDDTKQVCQVGTPSAECCNKSKFSPRGKLGVNFELSRRVKKALLVLLPATCKTIPRSCVPNSTEWLSSTICECK
jgi:hypothetical protein